MKKFSVVVDIESPPARVLAVLCDVERWPEWTSTMTSVRRIDDGPVAAGSRAHVRQPKLRPAVWQVTELDAGRGFSWASHSRGLLVGGRHYVERIGAGSKVTLSLEFSGFFGPLIARLFRAVNERYLATEAEGLRERCEEG